MFRKIICVSLAAVFFVTISGCGRNQKLSKTYIEYFDTAVTLIGYDNPGTFDELAGGVEKILSKYHKLFDIYNAYDGVNNLYTVNLNAGQKSVPVNSEIIDFLKFCKGIYQTTDGETSIALGSVLKLWHNARSVAVNEPEKAALPSADELRAASQHTDIEGLIIDEENDTVFLSDSDASLDVGAVAKGYVADIIVRYLEENDAKHYALNMGGMVSCIGDADGRPWNVGIIDPLNTTATALTVELSEYSLVTSGVYQRYFDLNSKRYHHIIDPDTLYPEDNFLSVSVLCPEAAPGDALSTALFNMTLDEGKALIEKNENISVLWILPDGSLEYGGEFEKYVK